MPDAIPSTQLGSKPDANRGRAPTRAEVKVETLIEIARDNDAVASFPVPQVRFTDLKAGAMTFELYCFVSDVEGMARTKSDLYFELYKRFKEAKFFDGPAPAPTGIDIIGLDRLEAILKESRVQAAEPPVRSRKAG